MSNQTRYVVITGASSGIGYEAAKAFAERGKNLIIIARRQHNLEELRAEILTRYPALDVVVKVADLSNPGTVFQLYRSLNAADEGFQLFHGVIFLSLNLGSTVSTAAESPAMPPTHSWHGFTPFPR